jgi:hypothetical protein
MSGACIHEKFEKQPSRSGYQSTPPPITRPGQIVEVDIMECDINDTTGPEENQESQEVTGAPKKKKHKSKKNSSPELQTADANTNDESPATGDATTKRKGNVKKLATVGGGLHCIVSIDRKTKMVHGEILKTLKSPEEPIERLILKYEAAGHPIECLVADVGMIPTSKFQVMTTEVEKLLLKRKIKHRTSEPHNHQNGTANVERVIRAIKELQDALKGK